MHAIGFDHALSLLYVNKALFHLVYDHVVFSLVAPILKYSGQKCLTFVPGGWHCDDLTYHQGGRVLPWHSSHD